MAPIKLLRIIPQPRNPLSIFLLLAFASLLMSTLTPFYFMAQGRQFREAHLRKEEEERGVKSRSVIGSRPPRCEQRCRSCGKCEAVQVPIMKFLKEEEMHGNGIIGVPTTTSRVEYSRGDDISSYKPMCWKCKCGDFYFNP